MHIGHIDLVYFSCVDVLADLAVLVGEEILSEVGRPAVGC